MNKIVLATTAYRWGIAARVLAAALGGYALASMAMVVMALLWPATRAQSVLWASMLSFAIYAAAVIWVFAVRGAFRAWAGILITTALLATFAWLLKHGGSI